MASPALTGVPTAPTATAGTNTTQLATTAFVKTAVDNLVDSAPGALDTLNELAAALNDDSNFHTTVTNQIATKQNTIGDGDLTIARTNGLQAALNSKQATIADGDLTIAKTNGLQAALNSKQATIADGDLTIAKTNGLQAALDSKQATIAGTLSLDTISEKTSGSGVTIDGVLLKDNQVTASTVTASNYAVGNVNFISATRQGNFRDVEVKNSSNQYTILLTGESGDIGIDGTLSANTISEKTSNSGVTIDGVLLKDNTVTASTVTASNYAVGNVNFISATRQGNFRDVEVKNSSNQYTILLTGESGDIGIDGTLSANTISEKTSNSGVTIDGVLLKDNTVTTQDITITGIPTAPTTTAGTNTTQLATTAFVKTAVDNLVDSAPGALDTLNELAAALNDDSNFHTTVTNSLAGNKLH